MRWQGILTIVLALAMANGVMADDLLGKKRGGSGNSGSSGSGGGGGSREEAPPRRSEPERAPRASDPERAPGRVEPNRGPSRQPDRSPAGREVIRVGGGRTGISQYGTNNNFGTGGSREPIYVPSYPTSRTANGGTIGAQVRREEDIRRNVQRYRQGYYGYDYGWRDDYFAYPHYGFSYDYDRYAVSPWYCYTHMPAYISTVRVDWNVPNGYRDRDWRAYSWRPSSRFDRYSPTYELDRSVADIVSAFQRRDVTPLDVLIPRGSRVLIDHENGDRYFLGSDDFYDMMVDLVRTTQTVRYDVVRVNTFRNEAEITAKHTYRNAWGISEARYHRYVLIEGRRGIYEIAEFAVGRRLP